MGLLADFYRQKEAWALVQIRAAQDSIASMAEVRERRGDNWEIEELTRVIIFEEAQFIDRMKGEAERAKAASKELEGI